MSIQITTGKPGDGMKQQSLHDDAIRAFRALTPVQQQFFLAGLAYMYFLLKTGPAGPKSPREV